VWLQDRTSGQCKIKNLGKKKGFLTNVRLRWDNKSSGQREEERKKE